jgi:serine/threonine-protein kinase
MASELRRYLAGEAVSVAGGTLYRAGKTLRRHRLGFALAALAIVGLLAAVAVAVANAREAESARRRAELVKDFIVDVFDASASGSGDNARLRQLPAELLLERGARMIDARFPADAAVRADLDGAVARIFVDMASPEPAVDYARRQLRELQALRAEPAARARAGLLLAQALLLARQATQAAEQASAALALAPDDAETGAGAHLLRAAAMLRLGRDRDVEDELTLADAALHAHPGLPGALRAQAERLRANRLNYLHNQFDRSLPLYRAAIGQALASEGPASPIAAGIRADLAYSLVNRHRGAEGMAYLDELLRSQRAIGGDDDVPSALAEASIAKWMYLTGQAAYEPTRRTLERDGEALRAHARRVPAQMAALLDYQLAAVEAERGLSESAYGRLSRDVPLLEQASDDRWSLYDELATWAGAATDSGRDDEALRLLDHALEVGAGVVSPSSPWLAGAYAAKARVLARLGRRAEALDFLRRLPSIEPARGDVSAPLRFRDSIAIAQAQLLLDEGRPREALATLPPVDGAAADDPIADRRLVRGAALCALGRREEGAALMSAALQRARAHHDGGYRPLRDWQARRERCLAAAR